MPYMQCACSAKFWMSANTIRYASQCGYSSLSSVVVVTHIMSFAHSSAPHFAGVNPKVLTPTYMVAEYPGICVCSMHAVPTQCARTATTLPKPPPPHGSEP